MCYKRFCFNDSHHILYESWVQILWVIIQHCGLWVNWVVLLVFRFFWYKSNQFWIWLCWLRPLIVFWKPLTGVRQNLVGVYVFIDRRRGFVRSGKTISVNVTFENRRRHHEAGAMNPSSRSHRRSLFYNSYPINLQTPQGRDVFNLGVFNDLKFVVVFVWKYEDSDNVSWYVWLTCPCTLINLQI